MADSDSPFKFRFPAHGTSTTGGSSSTAGSLVERWRKLNIEGIRVGISSGSTSGTAALTSPGPAISATGQVFPPTVEQGPPTEVVVGVELVRSLRKTDEGTLIQMVTPAWTKILAELATDPNALRKLNWRQLEELVAGAYQQYGWTVELTPRSNDKGRDVIATRDDIGAIRLLDQVKHYAPDHVVDAGDVREIFGVLSLDQRASKAIITTTSSFAPGVWTEFASVMPTRLELRDGSQLVEWLGRLRNK
jgi:restriction system protein